MRRLALPLWTLAVWGGRIRNAVDGDEGAGAVVLAATFVLLGVAALLDRRAAYALAGWTVAVWAVRIVDIAFLSDRSAAFIAVHVGLAVVSVALSAWTVTSLTRSARAPQPASG